MGSFLLEIITPEKIAFIGEVIQITAPSTSGMIGILPNHVPLFTMLTEGEVILKKENDEIYLAIGSGFLEVTPKKVTLLVTSAYNANEINEKEVMEARERASEALKQKVTGQAYIEAQSLFRRSEIALKDLRKRKKSFTESSHL
jgi:F-type H+-transporting ATPase subunit epsilon